MTTWSQSHLMSIGNALSLKMLPIAFGMLLATFSSTYAANGEAYYGEDSYNLSIKQIYYSSVEFDPYFDPRTESSEYRLFQEGRPSYIVLDRSHFGVDSLVNLWPNTHYRFEIWSKNSNELFNSFEFETLPLFTQDEPILASIGPSGYVQIQIQTTSRNTSGSRLLWRKAEGESEWSVIKDFKEWEYEYLDTRIQYNTTYNY